MLGNTFKRFIFSSCFTLHFFSWFSELKGGKKKLKIQSKNFVEKQQQKQVQTQFLFCFCVQRFLPLGFVVIVDVVAVAAVVFVDYFYRTVGGIFLRWSI